MKRNMGFEPTDMRAAPPLASTHLDYEESQIPKYPLS